MDARDKIQHQINWQVIKQMTIEDYAKNKELRIKQLRIQELKAARKEDYKKAAQYRDQIIKIKESLNKC